MSVLRDSTIHHVNDTSNLATHLTMLDIGVWLVMVKVYASLVFVQPYYQLPIQLLNFVMPIMFLLSLRIWSLLLSLLTLITAILCFTHLILWLRICSPWESSSKGKLAKVYLISLGRTLLQSSLVKFFLLHVHLVCCGRISLAILLLMLNPKMSILKLSPWSLSLSCLCHPSQLAKIRRLSFVALFSCSTEPPKSPSNPSTSIILSNHPYLQHLPTPLLLHLFCLPQLPRQQISFF